MFLLVMSHTVQTKGVNWGQALAIWLPIVTGIFALGGLIYRGVKHVADTSVERFASVLNVKLSDIEDHLKRQDERFDRIDRNTRKDSR